MLNELNQTIASADVTGVDPFLQSFSDFEELRNHPSYEKGFEAGQDQTRGNKPYVINQIDAIHLRAYSLGYNEGLQDA